MSLASLRFGYVPGRADAGAPGDRRRFAGWAARRGVAFDILSRPRGDYDVVVLTQQADISAWRRYDGRARLVFDLIDSYLAIPRTNLKARLRGPAKFAVGQLRHPVLDYWRELELMCARADAVVCVTGEQRDLIGRHAANVHIVLDLQESEVLGAKQSWAAGSPFALVWEGLPENIASLAVIADVLRDVARTRPLELRLVTDLTYYAWMGRFGLRSSLAQARRVFDRVSLHAWSPATLASVATGADLAIIPIPLDDALARGKPANKLLLFWRMAVPAVVSATPAYARAMAAAGTGIACTTPADWADALRRCVDDEALRREMGTRGRDYAARDHSDEQTLSRWDAVFASLFAAVRV